MARRMVLASLLAVLIGSPAPAQEWARKMFQSTSHDFGSVARDSKAEYEFVLSNIYVQDVHIASVRSSCNCTSPRVEKPLLKTYEKSAIIAHANTEAFRGSQSATITVTFDKPMRATVQLHVRMYIRSDVELDPAGVDLGDVDQGRAVEKTVTVTRTGRSDWRILEVKSGNPHLSGEVIRTSRGGNRVSHRVCVRLDEHAPPGYFKDCLILVTNDAQSGEIPVLVEGRVLSAVTVSPASLFLGVLKPGQEVTKQIVVRARKPFCITSMTADSDCFKFSTPAGQTPKPLHVVPVTFTAGDKAGSVVAKIRIETGLDGAAVEVSAHALVAD